ncbi:MAG TPA: lysine--tRNA ligase [Acidimicrobiales bacterium]|nr:lysine--tRNA ligase [Acidimicrobiales bacterium]
MSRHQTPDVPYRFPVVTAAAAVAAAHGGLASGGSAHVEVTVAGRIMLFRPQGGAAFADLRDWTGSIQLFADAKETERFDEFTRLRLGDWIGATGEVIRTRRGELSVKVAAWQLLAEARRGFGDKWQGVHDVETRYRQREVDLWANDGVRETFLLRSRVVRSLRQNLDDRGYVEVETPVLQPVAGGANARPFVTHFNSLHADFVLRIASELYLKRLVIGGFERVYEIGKDFRNEGLSPSHNPEFTVLEAYQAYADFADMTSLVEDLVFQAAIAAGGTGLLTHQGRVVDLHPPWRTLTLEQAVREMTGLDCSLDNGREALREQAAELGVPIEDRFGPGKILSEIYERTTEGQLWDPVHVIDHPVEVSPLTRRHRAKSGAAERATSVIAGREVAESYSELVDPVDQRARFAAQAAARAAGDDEAMVVDEEFLRALEHGMPPTGGIGIGIDRLVMLLADKVNIKEVMLFPALRPESPGKPGDAGTEGDG